MELSKREKRKFKLANSGNEAQKPHEAQKQAQEKPSGSRKTKFYFAFSAIGIIIIAAVAYSVYSANKPGEYDDFAKCLAEKGAVMYGAMDWCHFTQGQKAMFGKSFRYINYHEYTELPGIKKTPTWVINGKWYENAQAFDKLASLTGCKV